MRAGDQHDAASILRGKLGDIDPKFHYSNSAAGTVKMRVTPTNGDTHLGLFTDPFVVTQSAYGNAYDEPVALGGRAYRTIIREFVRRTDNSLLGVGEGAYSFSAKAFREAIAAGMRKSGVGCDASTIAQPFSTQPVQTLRVLAQPSAGFTGFPRVIRGGLVNAECPFVGRAEYIHMSHVWKQRQIPGSRCSARRWTFVPTASALLSCGFGLLVACRNTDSCCGLKAGEAYDIELMSEIHDGPASVDCPATEAMNAAMVGDSLRVEIMNLEYDDQVNCSEVKKLRIVSTTSVGFQRLIGMELHSDGIPAIGNRYHQVLGGDVDPPPSTPPGRWSFGLMPNWCDGVNEAFDPDNPQLVFGLWYRISSGSCVEAWAAKLTRVEE